MVRSSCSIALVLLALASGCRGSSGESCKRNDDCESSLVCCSGGATPTGGARGVCQSDCVPITLDAGTDSGIDAGTDAGMDSGVDADVDAGP